ncbi:MAG: 16S rRNA (adenine(1518)-N(6)/adenine(1519)-N(6))-dimethyltransferase RsmA [Candidatus Heimdallarchaeota archaeon]
MMIRKYAISPQRKLSQNFVVKKKVINAILSGVALKSSDKVIEVGGGLGTLTYFLLDRCTEVLTYEIDPLLATIIVKNLIDQAKKLVVVSDDFLKQKIPVYPKLVANLPYNISSPFIKKITTLDIPPETIAVTVQNEFAKHLCAKAGDANYSRISVLPSFFYNFEMGETFTSNCFYPQPKVKSSLVVGRRTKNTPPQVKETPFFTFLTNLFCRKHKKVKNNLLVYRKGIDDSKKGQFKRQLRKLEFSTLQTLNLSPEQILNLYIQFKEMMTELQK